MISESSADLNVSSEKEKAEDVCGIWIENQEKIKKKIFWKCQKKNFWIKKHFSEIFLKFGIFFRDQKNFFVKFFQFFSNFQFFFQSPKFFSTEKIFCFWNFPWTSWYFSKSELFFSKWKIFFSISEIFFSF